MERCVGLHMVVYVVLRITNALSLFSSYFHCRMSIYNVEIEHLNTCKSGRV